MTVSPVRIGLALTIAALLAACVAAPIGPVPSSPAPSSPGIDTGQPGPTTPASDAPSQAGPSAEPSLDLSGLDEATARAVRIRRSYGLRSDLDFIRQVATDPTATTEFGTPLLPRETKELFARSERADQIVPTIQQYAADHLSTYGGVWIDNPGGGVVTASFTDDLEPHRLALTKLLGGRGPFALVHARYSEVALNTLQNRISADDAWFKTIPARLLGVGNRTDANVVEIDISTANPAIVELIVAHFGIPADAIEVHSDGSGVAMEPWGTIHVRIVDVPANVRGELTLDYHSDRPGANCGMGDVGIGFAANGTVDLPCQGGHWVITAGRSMNDIVARGEVDLAPGGSATVTLRPVAP